MFRRYRARRDRLFDGRSTGSTVRSVRTAGHSCSALSRRDEDDQRIYIRLGIAVSKAQLLEIALVKLLEAERQDLSRPLDDRWEEISAWLGMTAGHLRKLLGVPEIVAKDLEAAIGRRNRIAHNAWVLYSTGEDSRASAEVWAPWLEGEASMLQRIVRGLAGLRDYIQRQRAAGNAIDDVELERAWREHVPEPVARRPDLDPMA